MLVTPWGDANALRVRKLKPRTRQSRAQVQRIQRERLFAAVVATVAEKGYEATTVADLVELSGVSRSTYYEHFPDKEGCFLAAVDAIVGPALERLTEESGATGEGDGREALAALVETIAAQPVAAKACLIEIYAAGPEAVTMLDQLVDALALAAGRMFAAMPEQRDLPPEIVRAIVGGVQKAVQKRLLSGEESALPGLVPRLWEWIVSIPAPPGPLHSDRQKPVRPRRFATRQTSSPPTERVLRALAAEVCERGYQEATVAAVVGRARTSQRTFYESFADKETALVAALDSGSAQMLAAALPAFHRAPDWPCSVRDTLAAMLRFAAAEPEYGRLGAVEMYAAGRRALEQRETVAESLEDLLAAGFDLAPDAPSLAPEATGGALYALLYDFVKEKGPERLPELVPTATYVTLAPFLGPEAAYGVAVS